ncbi:MAG: DNA double-strand break repair nuclease NurA [Infirmifilum sp.]
MPEFLDLLAEEISLKKSYLEEIAGKISELSENYKRMVVEKWRPLPPPLEVIDKIFAVDSSTGIVEVRGGGVVLVARSMALAPFSKSFRKLIVDALYPRNTRDFEEYVRLMREHIEHAVALESLEDEPEFILIDGSLYGRMIHVLMELDLEGREDFMFEYVRTYSDFLTQAVKRGVTVLGVSKDSRSTLFKEELLKKKVLEVASESGVEVEEVLRLWTALRRRPREVLEKVREKVRSGEFPAVILDYFEQARSHVPDSRIILEAGVGQGYSTPLILSLSKVIAGQFDLVLDERASDGNIEKLASVFEKSADKHRGEFVKMAHELIAQLRSYPPVLMSYTIMGPGDDPLRVDIISKEISDVGFLKSGALQSSTRFTDDDTSIATVERSLSLLRGLYAGEKGYNVLLLEVDRRVKISAATLETYRRVIMRELDTLILHSRGERRVHYP